MDTIKGTPKNDLLLRALNRQHVERPPVWMMRQAGRYLPDYQKLRAKYSFFERVQSPELVSEITLMPVDQVGVDAAILFSDILVVPQAMGMEVQMLPGKGPWLPDPITHKKQIESLNVETAHESLIYVYDAVKQTLADLDNAVPLIGFAGSPWTIMCYMVQGSGSKDFSKAKRFLVEEPALADQLLESITKVTVNYLLQKVESGAQVIQLFDSWGGVLSPEMYHRWSFPHMAQICSALRERVPVILFAKGCRHALASLADLGPAALGVDWTVEPSDARELVASKVVLQGNFDPSCLYGNPERVYADTQSMIRKFGTQSYVANLGHGILPDIPVENAKAFVNAVKEYSDR